MDSKKSVGGTKCRPKYKEKDKLSAKILSNESKLTGDFKITNLTVYFWT